MGWDGWDGIFADLINPSPIPGGGRQRMDVVSWRCRARRRMEGSRVARRRRREEDDAERVGALSCQTLPDPRRCSRMDAVSKRFEAERVPRGPDLIWPKPAFLNSWLATPKWELL